MSKRTLKRVGLGVAILLGLGGIAVGLIHGIIHHSVQEYIAVARQHHTDPGNDVDALIAFIHSDQHSFGDRNHAIWALGRLRDSSALLALRNLYTGKSCDHQRGVCQYELKKAILLCGGTPEPPRASAH